MSIGQVTAPHSEHGEGKQKPAWFPITLITFLALGLRLAWLGSKSLRIDEADSFYFASQSFSAIFGRLCDPHPPGYYALLRVFLRLGQDEFWVRLPSAIAGALTVPLLYILGRDLVAALGGSHRRTPLLASLLLAVAPLHVWYAQDARMYVLVTALGLCCAIYALRVALHGRTRDALGYLLFATTSLYVDQSSLLPLTLANLLWGGLWLWQRSQNARSNRWEIARWVGLQLMVGLAFYMWWSRAFFRSKLDVGVLYQLTMVKLVLQRFGLSVSSAGLRWAFAAGAVVLLAVGALIAWLLVRQRWLHRAVSLLVPAIVVLFALFTVGSAVPRLFTFKRLVLSLLPYGLLLSAWAIQRLQLRRWQTSALVAFSLALCAVNVLWVSKEPWRELVHVLQQELEPGDVVWVDELAVPAFDYYYSGANERFIWRAANLFKVSHDEDVNQRGTVGGGRIWLVAVVDPYRNLLDYLPATWEPVQSNDWHRVSVRAYAQPLSGTAGVSDRDLPSWLLTWPSPVHEACREGE